MSGISNIGLLPWQDSRAWMESMRGTRWNRLINSENRAFDEALMDISSFEEFSSTVQMFEAAEKGGKSKPEWNAEVGTTKVRVYPQGGGAIQWCWEHEKGADAKEKHPLCGDLDIASGGLIVYTHDIGKGAIIYELVNQQRDKILWRWKGEAGRGVGPTVAIVGTKVYCLEAESVLRYIRLISLDLQTGKGRRVLYEEQDRSSALTLVKGERGCLFLVSENAGRQKLFHVGTLQDQKVEQLCPDGVSFYPVGYAVGHTEPCYFVRRDTINSPWEACGRPLESWKLSYEIRTYGLEMVSLSSGFILCRNHGERMILLCSRRKHPQVISRIIGVIEINPWARWEGRSGQRGSLDIDIIIPGATSTRGFLNTRKGLVIEEPEEVYAGNRVRGTVKCVDGTHVHWICVWDANYGPRPKALLVTGYGAYGVPTNLSTSRWKPYLKKGFAIGFAFIRGGGDSTESWAEEGRRRGKLRGVQDFEACVVAMQKLFKISPDKTCIFGRSAGGYLIGATVARHPDGDLFRYAYTEVPYVDVLRTASNPTLPLTEYEYREFGDPAHNIADFEFLLRFSPIQALKERGAPGVFVICRTALNDSQVFAYESFKWIDALRGKNSGGQPKLLGITRENGHFLRGASRILQQAEDFLILCKKIIE